jgi:hypothetical protein
MVVWIRVDWFHADLFLKDAMLTDLAKRITVSRYRPEHPPKHAAV